VTIVRLFPAVDGADERAVPGGFVGAATVTTNPPTPS
jgi:hypothetical protein